MTDEEDEIPVRLESVYHPLNTDQDWTCCAHNQERRSHINISKATGRILDLQPHQLMTLKAVDGVHAQQRWRAESHIEAKRVVSATPWQVGASSA
ncbi:MAG: hypothetical protein WCF33_06300 [Pseudonocardiaceae bacterium]